MLGLQRSWGSQTQDQSPLLRCTMASPACCPAPGVIIPGIAGFLVKPFTDLGDLRLRAMWSQEGHTVLHGWDSSARSSRLISPDNFSCFLWFYFTVWERFTPDVYCLLYFIIFLFPEVLAEILSGMKGICTGTLRKTEVLEEPLWAGLSPTPSLEAAHAALRW